MERSASGFKMEHLLPLVARLADKYTSKESSSVSAGTAAMLMEAVLYCIEECFTENGAAPVSGMSGENGEYEGNWEHGKATAEALYKRGSEIAYEKVMEAKNLYEKLAESFEDYGCRNYRDTVLKGMPGFFKRYDIRFAPQKHILTLDYPLLNGNPPGKGIDLIREYLGGLTLEKKLLDCFDRRAVISLLSGIMPDYKSVYMDNICNAVFLQAIGCVIADRPLGGLLLEKKDCMDIALFFKGEELPGIEDGIRKMGRLLTDRIPELEALDYFAAASRDFAVRIENGMQNNTLHSVFQTV